MKAWMVVEAKQPLQCFEIETPVPTGTQVLIETTHCGVCHSDLHFWKGQLEISECRSPQTRHTLVQRPHRSRSRLFGQIREQTYQRARNGVFQPVANPGALAHLVDPPAADHKFLKIKDCGLSRSDGALRRIDWATRLCVTMEKP